MNKLEYINQDIIEDFIAWMIPNVSGEANFTHKYLRRKNKKIWSCSSVFDAYENYEWQFICVLPTTGKERGSTFSENAKILKILECEMGAAIKDNNHSKLQEYSLAVLKWGGVTNGNESRIKKMGEDLVSYLKDSIVRLDPVTVDTNDDFSGVTMNSGFTKLYSLIIEDFVIYDGRVGAALGLFVKKYLTEKNIESIPEELKFAYGKARSSKSEVGLLNSRNPSDDKYKFPAFTNDHLKRIKYNIYANWLLKELAEKSIFNTEQNSLRALESALFMIGYSVN